MKILWLTYFGSWTRPLADCIAKHHQLTLLIPSNDKKEEEVVNEVKYIYVKYPMHEAVQMMSPKIFSRLSSYIERESPDIIHVHGTEKNLAQIQRYIGNIPVVTSIQGILMGYLPYVSNYLDMQTVKKFKTIKNLMGRGGALQMEKLFRKGYTFENDILCHNSYFIGRTDFDRSHIMFRNPKAQYFVGEELLRDEFYKYDGLWDIDRCERLSIFMPSGFNPIKGMHLAIETVRLLKPFYHNVKLYIPGVMSNSNHKQKLLNFVSGEEYIRYTYDIVIKYHLEDNIVFMPRLSAEEMAQHMGRAHVFLAPSSIDNSPNAVGEATMIGCPIVTTPVGGIPSFLHDGVEALLSPAGDPYLLAYYVKKIFDDDILACKLSQNANLVAKRRHNKEYVCQQYEDIYKEVVNLHKSQMERGC